MDENRELVKEYHEREIRWTNMSLSQLSFFNNFLLTLSVGFLSFSYEHIEFNGIRSTCQNINWPLTFSTFSLILIVISIIVGLKVAINRLLDFRCSREINKVRHQMMEHAGEKLDESSSIKFSKLRRLILPLELMNSFPKITIEECKSFNDLDGQEKSKIKERFKEIRNFAYNLGLSTWRSTYFQIFYFGISLLLYLAGHLVN